MKRVTLTVTACVLAVIALLSVGVQAQDTNTQKRTFMTFSNTVEMPGVTLPAGTYLFRLADTDSRNVVQVLSQDEKDVLGQWLFVQSERPQASDETVVMFKEAREGSTPAVQSWYYPGERIGREFIYPKDQGTKIAARTGNAVMTEDGRVSPDAAQTASADAQAGAPAPSASASASADQANASAQATGAAADNSADNSNAGLVAGNSIPAPAADQNAQSQSAAVGTSGAAASGAVGTSGAEAQADRAVSNDAAAPVREGQTARAELPRTASPLPLSGLVGLLALFGALGTRSLAARR